MNIERFSNNNQPALTDEEVVTIFLFGILRKHFTLKDIHQYTNDHLLDWFPELVSYQGFVNRLNRACFVFPSSVEWSLERCPNENVRELVYSLDSMPIVIAKGSQGSGAKVASEYADKGGHISIIGGFYGVKIRVLGNRAEGGMPYPNVMMLSPTSCHDSVPFKSMAPHIG